MRKWIFIFLTIIPILIHFYVLKEYTFDFPFEDDFRVIVKYLYLYLSQNTWQEKLNIFLLGENESFPLLQRLLVSGQYYFTGEQHIKGMLIFCNLLLGFLVYVFYKNAKNTPPYVLVLISLLLFNTIHHELYFRLDVASYQFFAMFMAVCSIYLASKWVQLSIFEKALFIFLFLIAPFGSINGILTHFLVLLIFIFSKNYRTFLGFLIVSVLTFLFIKSLPSDNGASASIFDNILKYNFQLAYAYFLSLGGMFLVFQSQNTFWIPALMGVFIFAANAFLIFKFYKKQQWFEIFLFLFAAITLAVVVVLRYNYWQSGYESVLGSRYKIYGALMCVSALMLYLKNYQTHARLIVYGASLVIVGAFVIGAYRGLQMLNQQRLMQLTEAHNIDQNILSEKIYSSRYINFKEQSFLEKRNAFTSKTFDKKLEKIIQKSDTLAFNNFEFEIYKEDPSTKGDWGRMNIPLHHFKIFGAFKQYKFYFARISDPRNKNIIVYLLPPTNSILDKIKGDSQIRLPYLSRDFYFSFFVLETPLRVQVYGTNELK
jgi:hypothetical protein